MYANYNLKERKPENRNKQKKKEEEEKVKNIIKVIFN